MSIDINIYLTGGTGSWMLHEMQKDLERKRIVAEATLIKNKRNTVKKYFKEETEASVKQTKTAISAAEKQMDTAIQGKVRDKLEQLVLEKLPEYDTIL